MLYNNLGRSALSVSRICLGTMTFGQQNTYEEAVAQLDLALDRGINFIDTAEMYPVPANPATSGSTEKFIGRWIQERKNRTKFVLATKVTGPGLHVSHVSPKLGFYRQRIMEAVDNSLSRLQTDYIDLYQLHWPERKTNCFGKLGFTVDPQDTWQENFAEVTDTLHELKTQGKILHWGISNETPWGVMRFLQAAKKYDDFSPLSIQNPYNLLNRTFEIGLAEIAYRESLGLLAYSPLAFGLLTGKYHNKTASPDNRLNQFKQMARYNSEYTYAVAEKYCKLAAEYGISPAQMSIAYLLTKPWVRSVIIGATNLSQLHENIGAIDLVLSTEIGERIEKIHLTHQNPAP